MKQLFSLILLIIFQLGIAQIPEWNNPNFRKKKFATADTIQLDSLFILNEKITLKDLNGNVVEEQNYVVDFEKGILYLNNLKSDSIQIEYYVHPNLRRFSTYPKDPVLIVPSSSENNAIMTDNRNVESTELFDGLQTQGNMVRGITFGNNQGSSVQSSLDLRLNGQLSEKVGIRAMISDTNVPIEADGYTQNLEQFDRVFVELFTDQSRVRAGHVDLEQTQEYFGNFNRRVTGMHLKHTISGENSTSHFQAAGSVARGEFKHYRFRGTEGIQGPYRLQGNHGEAYVIILSGSERIYKNGILLQRGENYDYVVNYNTGEITFTNRHLISSTDRITAEYQYTNRNYNRFSLYGGASHTGKRFSISSHIYSESDNKHNAINQTLTAEDQQVLAEAGNDVNQMYTSSAVQTPYEEGKVLYRKIVINGNEIFEYSTNPEEILYQVGFTQMGENQGDYILSENGINGRVFEYVSPQNGIPQGNFAPVKLLVAPKAKQVWSMATLYKLKNNGLIHLDAGLSNVDQNLFSDLDDEKNVGLALKLGVSKKLKFNKLSIVPEFNYEFIQAEFSPLERLRSTGFARDFNLKQEIGIADQHFVQSNLSAKLNDSMRVKYGIDYLSQSNQYTAMRHRFSGMYVTEKMNVIADVNLMHSESGLEETNFNEHNIAVERKIGKVYFGSGILGESNVRRVANGQDSLSFRWNEIYATAKLGDTVSRYVQLRVYQRKDDSTQLQRLVKYSTSLGAEFNTQLIKSENQGIKFLTHYRTVSYEDSLQQISFLNATIEWRRSLWKKAVELGLTYEISGGTELQRAFTYVQVADGLGIYKWLDYNQDGIQQLDEFEIAEFSDQANFIRVYTNTVDQLRTNQNGLNFSFRFQPARYFGNDSYWHRIESSVIYSTMGNYLKNNELAAWNPWRGNEDIRSESSQFYWQNKFNSALKYRFNLTHELNFQNNTRFVFTGLETLNQSHNKISGQYKLKGWLTAELMNRFSWVESNSDAFASKRFRLEGVEWVPKLYFKWSENLKSSIAYNRKNYDNTSGIEALKSGQLNFEFNWNDKEKTSLLAAADWVKNDFTGNQDSVVGNRMMEGLRDGNNLVWRFLLQRNINNYLELNVQYSGRKNEDYKAVHTGNMQLRLNF